MPGSDPGGEALRPPFDALVAVHRQAMRFHRKLLILLIVLASLTLVAAALASGSAAYPLFALGLFLLSLTATPWHEMAERRDRIQGLNVLREEWDELVDLAGADGVARLRRLFDRLYRFAD